MEGEPTANLTRDEWPTGKTPQAAAKPASSRRSCLDGVYLGNICCGVSLKGILKFSVVLGLFTMFASQIIYTIGPLAIRPYTFAIEITVGVVFTIDVLLRMVLVKNFFFHRPIYAKSSSWGRKHWWSFLARPNLVSVFDLVSGPGGLIVDVMSYAGSGHLTGLGTVLRSTRVFSLGVVQDIFLRLVLVTPEIGASVLASFVLMFMFSYFGHFAYGVEYPEFFGNMFSALFTLFQLMTLDEWAKDVVRPICEQYPTAYIYFLTYMLVAGFLVIHVFTGIVISGLLVGQEGSLNDSDQFDLIGYLYNRSNEETRSLMEEPISQIRSLSKFLQTAKLQYANSHAGLEAKIFKLKRDLQQRDGTPDSVMDDSWLIKKVTKSPRSNQTTPRPFSGAK